MVLKETIPCYKQHQTPVICTFLDASKAFDSVWYCKLFNLLLKRQLLAHILWVFISLYTNSCVRIAWGPITSDYFSVVNGVKQGAVLNPVRFCVYIDDLLLLLKKAGFGCHIGARFVGALAYADNIVLVAPSATVLPKMLAIWEDYGDEYCICFNAAKSECIVILPICRRSLAKEFQSCIFYVAKNPLNLLSHFYILVIHLYRNSTMMKILLLVILTLFVTQTILFVIFGNCIRMHIIDCVSYTLPLITTYLQMSTIIRWDLPWITSFYSRVCSSRFAFDPFYCAVWCVICSQSVNCRPKCFILRTALSSVYKWCFILSQSQSQHSFI